MKDTIITLALNAILTMMHFCIDSNIDEGVQKHDAATMIQTVIMYKYAGGSLSGRI